MDRFNSWHFAAIYWIAGIFLWAEKLLHAIDSHETTQPVPFIVVTHEKSNIAVTGFVSTLWTDKLIRS
jgi:hypothetical protein